MSTTSTLVRPAPNDRLRFDGKSTSWLVRAVNADGRYAVATASFFGQVAYTVLDFSEGVRGPLNVIGGGMGIFTTSGPDEAIDEVIARLDGTWDHPHCTDGWEVSHRNRVRLDITDHRSSS